MWDGAQWQHDSRSAFEYAGIRRTEERSDRWNGTTWDSDMRTSYITDGDAGLIEQREQWMPDVMAFVPADRYHYAYTLDAGTGATVVSNALYQAWDGNGWIDEERTTYSVSSDGGVE